jgi:16S rRNA (cytidine1402-2'-O)-methyltransferase
MNDKSTEYPELFIVATPIGNISDISQRAIETIKNAEAIIAENSHKFKKLCSLLQIEYKTKKIITFGDFNQASQKLKNAGIENPALEKALNLIKSSGKTVLVTEAGTPLISDPGYKIVEKIRSNFINIKVMVVPGPSALTAHLSISGLPTDNIFFIGFLPKKKGKREKILNSFKDINKIISTTFVIYESKYKLLETVTTLSNLYPDSTVSIGNELTKMHEKVFFGNSNKVLEALEKTNIKGEYVIHLKIDDN